MSITLVLASSNRGKIAELSRLLPADVEILLAGDLGVSLPLESGRTFSENAELKAKAAASATGQYAIGDDSGLEVDALDGSPGVRSARFAGVGATDQQNIEKLLLAMTDVPEIERTARFRCVVALAAPDGTTLAAEGEAQGLIGIAARGGCGFGYDPVFVISDGRTFAELSAEEKDALSHRGQALRSMGPELTRLLAAQNRD